eukprot:363744-Chlamydomonas_euryale.AAC.1
MHDRRWRQSRPITLRDVCPPPYSHCAEPHAHSRRRCHPLPADPRLQAALITFERLAWLWLRGSQPRAAPISWRHAACNAALWATTMTHHTSTRLVLCCVPTLRFADGCVETWEMSCAPATRACTPMP